MVDANDIRGMRAARALLGRHGIDCTRADIRVQHGICHIRGYISKLANANIPDLNSELERLAGIIRQKPEIRNVILEVTFQGQK